MRVVEPAGEVRLRLEDISKAKLVLTDELIAAATADTKRN